MEYEQLIRTKEYWEELLDSFAYRCAINSQVEINKEIENIVAKIMEIKKTYSVQQKIDFLDK